MKQIERKDFLKLGGSAVAGGAVGWVFSGAPINGLQWIVELTQDMYVPGKGSESFVQSVNDACPYGCEVTVRLIKDRAVQLVSEKGLCPSCINEIHLAYHPERITTPLKRKGSKGSDKFVPVSWEEAIKDITAKVNGVKKAGAVASISKCNNISGQLLERLVKSAGSNHSYMEASLDSINTSVLGGVVNYDFAKSDLIVSFGAKILEGWGNSCEMNQIFPSWAQKNTKFIQIDTNQSRSGSIADEFIAVKPGTEGILAMGIANYLIKVKKMRSSGEGFARWSQTVINHYPLKTVAKLTGVSEATIKKLGNALSRARNPIAVGGKGSTGICSTAVDILAVQSLNSLVKTKAVTIKKVKGLNNGAIKARGTKFAGLDSFIKGGSPEVLFINNADPAYKSTLGADLKEKMKKAFVVSMSPLMNDTALYADYILPTRSFLESTGSKPAVVKAVGKSKQVTDIIIEIAKGVKGAKNKFPWTSSADLSPKTTLTSGTQKFSYKPNKLKKAMIELKKSVVIDKSFPLFLMASEAALIGDGDGLAYPYVSKATDTKVYSEEKVWVTINRETAEKLGLCEGSKIDIASKQGELDTVKVHLSDTVAPDVIEIPLGYGHEALTKYAKEKGVNAKTIMNNTVEPVSGNADWTITAVKIS